MCEAWHDVSEELPAVSGTYLIATSRKRIVTATFTELFNRFNGTAGKSCTHWRELPEGPWDEKPREAAWTA